MNLPAIRNLRQNYPKAWLTLALDKSVADLFTGHPDLDEVLTVDAAELASSGSARQRLMRRIREIGFDMAVVSNPSKLFHWLSFRCGIPLRVGWGRKWGFFLNRSLSEEKFKGRTHEIDSNLALVALVCAEKWDGVLRIVPDESAAAKMRKTLEAFDGHPGVIVVHTGTSDSKKRWSPKNFLDICRRIQERRMGSLVFIGGAEESGTVEAITRELSGPSLDLTGKTSLKELAALFADRSARVLISSDSGPVHVAWMSGKPVVAIYAKDAPGCDPNRWGPRDDKSEIIFKPLSGVGTDEVLERLEKVLRRG